MRNLLYNDNEMSSFLLIIYQGGRYDQIWIFLQQEGSEVCLSRSTAVQLASLTEREGESITLPQGDELAGVGRLLEAVA